MQAREELLTTNTRSIAMLIDGDNAQPKMIVNVLAEVAKYGIVSVRRIYGDWTTPNMAGWKDSLQTLAVQPVQQFRYTLGKNATDSALIIDAMDLLHSDAVNGFCIVSSDSDYTRLATRIREQGMFVMGIGRSHTPKSFVNACEVFVYTENLWPESLPTQKVISDERNGSSNWKNMVEQAIEMSAQDDGWTFLGAVGNNLRQLDPAFDPRSFGHKQLSQLVRTARDRFEIREMISEGGNSLVYIKLKSTNESEEQT